MWKATIRGLLARKVRLALTALSVLLGVSFVVGTYVLTDTLDASFQTFFRQTLQGVDVVVRAQGAFGGGGERARFSDLVVPRLRSVPGVGSASGALQGYAQFVDQEGDAIQTGGAPTLGIAWGQDGREGPLGLTDDRAEPGGCVAGRGRPPRGPHEVAMDVGTARKHGFRIGDEVDVLLQGPKERFCIVGLFGFGGRSDSLPFTFAAFDVPTAQHALAAVGELDAVNVTVESGVAPRVLRDRIRTELGPSFDVTLATAFASDQSRQFTSFFALLTQLLLGFAAIGLVVGGFIIFNTFAILVAQRTREFGLLRAMGASGRQVMVAVVAEAGMVGLVAAAAGLAAGIGLAALLLSLLGRAGFDVPTGSLVVQDRTVIAAFGIGVLVTVASSIVPALRAARISPITAINDTPEERPRPFLRRRGIGALLVAGSVPCLIVGVRRSQEATDVTSEIWLVAVGALLLFFGVLALLATFARSLAGVIGRPLRAGGVTGTLARANAMRNPRRTSATASALVIGLALVGLVAIFGQSAKVSVTRAVDRGIRADYVLKAQQFAGFSPQVAERLRALPELGGVAAFRFSNVRVRGSAETVAGVDPTELASVVDLGLRSGSIDQLGPDGMLVYRKAAEEYGLRVGDTELVQFQRGFVPLRVAGIYDQEDFTGGFPVPFVVSKTAYDSGLGPNQQDSLVYVKAKGGNAAAAGRAIEASLGQDFPNIGVFTREQYKSDQEGAIDQFLAVTVALLLLAEIIAVLGIVNTLALSVFERTHELGLMRAVGMSRRQTRRMIRGESVIIALVGGLVGTAIGLVWGWAFTAALESQGISEVSIPVGQLAVFVGLSMVAGVVAAVLPAWRAGRLDVLGAIATH